MSFLYEVVKPGGVVLAEDIDLLTEYLKGEDCHVIDVSGDSFASAVNFLLDKEIVDALPILKDTGLRLIERKPGATFSLQDQQVDVETCRSAVTGFILSKARSLGYDSVESICSYSNSSVSKFRREARAFIPWRDASWVKCFARLEAPITDASEILQEINDFEQFLDSEPL